MSLRDDINEALKNYLDGRGLDVAQVIFWEDDTERGGYCETCSYEYAVVHVTYLDSKSRQKTHTIVSSFSELIGAI